MHYDCDDTIAAIASAAGPAARGIVRISGPDVAGALARCFHPAAGEARGLDSAKVPRRMAGSIAVDGNDGQPPLDVSGHLLLWPRARSYTRQPSAEFHAIGSQPVLAAIIEQLVRGGVRLAEPGEFTLRAFLAGRIDLTQAEAVLGVIDARQRVDLDAALDQLAGGLSRPLHRLRQQLLDMLAELEAGLDFVEEDIQFISRAELRDRLDEISTVVTATLVQMQSRDLKTDAPRAALVGPPNAGKSSLFNAMVQRYGAAAPAALVAPEPGVTRDWLVASIKIDGVRCELVDTAGEDDREGDELHRAAQTGAAEHKRRADVRLHCVDATSAAVHDTDVWPVGSVYDLIVITKADLAAEVPRAAAAYCSSKTGAGIDALARVLAERVGDLDEENVRGSAASLTTARCTESLKTAAEALSSALDMCRAGGDDLIAADMRAALNALGEVVGAVYADDLLDVIFSRFCIGK